MKPVAGFFQLGPDLKMIVNFAVEDDYGVTIFAANGLIAGLQVQDFEAGSAEGTNGGFVDTLLVGSAVDQGSRRGGNAFWPRGTAFMSESNYTAHNN
jgi:hypothetical protein